MCVEDSDPDAFWELVRTNLAGREAPFGHCRREIPSELARIVEFLNEQMATTEVIALEVEQYVEEGGQRQTLVPRIVGRTQAARDAKDRILRTLLGSRRSTTSKRMSGTKRSAPGSIPCRSGFGNSSPTRRFNSRSRARAMVPFAWREDTARVVVLPASSLCVDRGALRGRRSPAEIPFEQARTGQDQRGLQRMGLRDPLPR